MDKIVVNSTVYEGIDYPELILSKWEDKIITMPDGIQLITVEKNNNVSGVYVTNYNGTYKAYTKYGKIINLVTLLKESIS